MSACLRICMRSVIVTKREKNTNSMDFVCQRIVEKKKNVKQQSWNMEPASTYPKMETSTICVGDLFDKAHNPNLGSLHFSPLHSTLSISSLCSELIVALFSCMNFQIEY